MKKHLVIAALLCLFSIAGFSQAKSESKSNVSKVPGQTSFYAELGGPGILFSANIDRRFKASRLGFGWRFGIGFVTADESTIDQNGYYSYEPASVITVPAGLNYIFGKEDSPHTFEVGAGVTYAGKKLDIYNFYDDKTSQWFGTFTFMYRRQPVNGGFSWRIGFTPLVAKGYIQPAAGVSLGYNF